MLLNKVQEYDNVTKDVDLQTWQTEQKVSLIHAIRPFPGIEVCLWWAALPEKMKQDDGDQWQYQLDNHAQITAICSQSHHHLHAQPSILPHKIPKSQQSAALSLETPLIHAASTHYWTGECQIPSDPRNQIWAFLSYFCACWHWSNAVPSLKSNQSNFFFFSKRSNLLSERQAAAWHLEGVSSKYSFIQHPRYNIKISNAGWKHSMRRLCHVSECLDRNPDVLGMSWRKEGHV